MRHSEETTGDSDNAAKIAATLEMLEAAYCLEIQKCQLLLKRRQLANELPSDTSLSRQTAARQPDYVKRSRRAA